MPHMGPGPKIIFERYVNDPLEKSMPNIVTYLGKILNKWRFPEGGPNRPPHTLIGLK